MRARAGLPGRRRIHIIPREIKEFSAIWPLHRGGLARASILVILMPFLNHFLAFFFETPARRGCSGLKNKNRNHRMKEINAWNDNIHRLVQS